MEAACREPTFVENHDTCMANNHEVTEYETIPVHQHLYKYWPINLQYVYCYRSTNMLPNM